MFKRAIEIATNKGACNKGYVNTILKQWNENNIKSISDLNAYQVSGKNRGESGYGKSKYESSKSKYARELENEDESLYQNPTPEQLEEIRKLIEKQN